MEREDVEPVPKSILKNTIVLFMRNVAQRFERVKIRFIDAIIERSLEFAAEFGQEAIKKGLSIEGNEAADDGDTAGLEEESLDVLPELVLLHGAYSTRGYFQGADDLFKFGDGFSVEV
jgi:hypothetical protein